MTVPFPLTIRVSTANVERDITQSVSDLRFRWTDPGGFAACQVTLNRPIMREPTGLEYFSRLTVHDGRTGAVMWEGRLEEPGRSVGGDGQTWQLAAIGGQAHTYDRTVALFYIDRGVSDFARTDVSAAAATGGPESDGSTGAVEGLMLRFPQGMTIVPGDPAYVSGATRMQMRNYNLSYANQRWAYIGVTIKTGKTTTGFDWHFAVVNPNGYRNLHSHSFSTTSARWVRYVGTGGGNWMINADKVDFEQTSYSGTAGPVADDNVWTSYTNVVIKAQRFFANGFQITDYQGEPESVKASDVVHDLVGRLLPAYDGANAVIQSSGSDYAIQQLTYPGGATPNQVLNDLMAYDSSYTWRVWESTAVANPGILGTETFETATPIFNMRGSWIRTNSSANSGTWSLRSGVISDGQASDMIVDVPPGATTMEFWHRVRSEAGFDLFEVFLDNVMVFQRSGTIVWTKAPTFDVSKVSRVTFRYSRDLSVAVGEDAAFIDDLTFSGVTVGLPPRRYRFEWVKVPSTVRYEATLTDGFDSQGSSDGLYNDVSVVWRDKAEQTRITTGSAAVPMLSAAHVTRTGRVDIGTSTATDAARVASQWLAEHRVPAASGRLRIARPIQDLETGRMVQPWEIRPGLIRLRGVDPTTDALNATARDGAAVFRIIAAEFSASDGAATLELDTKPSTLSQMLARLAAKNR